MCTCTAGDDVEGWIQAMKLLCYSYMDLEKGVTTTKCVNDLLTNADNVAHIVCVLSDKAAWVSVARTSVLCFGSTLRKM